MDDEKTEKPAKKGGLMALLGVPAEGDEGDEMEGGDMALKAAWRAIQEDDCEGFCEAMTEWLASNGSSD